MTTAAGEEAIFKLLYVLKNFNKSFISTKSVVFMMLFQYLLL